jgi:hypothetical protein
MTTTRKVNIWTLASDTDCGTNAEVFTKAAAYKAKADGILGEDWPQEREQAQAFIANQEWEKADEIFQRVQDSTRSIDSFMIESLLVELQAGERWCPKCEEMVEPIAIYDAEKERTVGESHAWAGLQSCSSDMREGMGTNSF